MGEGRFPQLGVVNFLGRDVPSVARVRRLWEDKRASLFRLALLRCVKLGTCSRGGVSPVAHVEEGSIWKSLPFMP